MPIVQKYHSLFRCWTADVICRFSDHFCCVESRKMWKNKCQINMSTLFGVTCPSDSGSCMMISCHKQGKVLICMQKTTSFAKSNQRNLIFSTKDTLESGHFMSVINILMQLRKVCNHPNLFEPRPIVSPFYSEQIVYHAPSLATKAMERDPFKASYFSVILVLG